MSRLSRMAEAEVTVMQRFGHKVRSADERDARALALLHIAAGKRQPGAFLPKLGVRFLTRYYTLLIEERDNLILCAVDDADQVMGFVSGTLSAHEHFVHLARNRLRLLLSVSLRAFLSPGILLGLWRRSYIVTETQKDFKFVVPSGARIEYWAWDPDRRDHSCTVLLMLAFLERVRKLHVRSVRLEVDMPNRQVWLTQRMLGAKIINRFRTPDGKDRLILEHVFDDKEDC